MGDQSFALTLPAPREDCTKGRVKKAMLGGLCPVWNTQMMHYRTSAQNGKQDLCRLEWVGVWCHKKYTYDV